MITEKAPRLQFCDYVPVVKVVLIRAQTVQIRVPVLCLCVRAIFLVKVVRSKPTVVALIKAPLQNNYNLHRSIRQQSESIIIMRPYGQNRQVVPKSEWCLNYGTYVPASASWEDGKALDGGPSFLAEMKCRTCALE